MNILGYDYSLRFSKIREMFGNVGTIDFDSKLLTVALDVSFEDQLSIIIHEIIEAIDYHLELELTHKQVCALEVGIFSVLKSTGVDLTPLIVNKKEELYIGCERKFPG
jgi:hypothetical protein